MNCNDAETDYMETANAISMDKMQSQVDEKDSAEPMDNHHIRLVDEESSCTRFNITIQKSQIAYA